MILVARYVVPVSSPVIENGAVEILQGRITAVGRRADLTRRADEQVTDYGDAVICPGLVNAHTHLELTHLAGRIPAKPPFPSWLREITTLLIQSPPTPEEVRDSVRDGIAQSLAAGTTTIGDITREPTKTRPILAESPLRGVSFGEVIAIGTRRHLLQDRLAEAIDWPQGHRHPHVDRPNHDGGAIRITTGRERPRDPWHWRVGLSPHSPYTVEPDALRLCAQTVRDRRLPTCVHVAECADESAFTRSAGGPLAEFLRSIGVWDERIVASNRSPIELLAVSELLTAHTILAHANYVDDAEIARIAASGAGVAYCPRTHAAFDNPPHRVLDMLRAGVNVCLGTDSLATNPSLSILDELRFLRTTRPDVSPDLAMRLATLHGAAALGVADTCGAIEPGKAADLAVIPMETPYAGSWGSIFEGGRNPVAVYVNGVLQHTVPL
ncbi:MAG: amidohydrolase family protein [Planctomycetota bacterium]